MRYLWLLVSLSASAAPMPAPLPVLDQAVVLSQGSDYDPAILKPYRDRLFVFGCVDPGNTPVPSLDSVKRKIARALEHLDPTRVLLAPDCGLMTIPRALARDKLKVMVQAARELRG